MATELQRLSRRVSDDFLGVARRVRRGSLFVKIALLGVGSAVAAIAQFVQFAPTGPTAWQIAGILASLIVLIGGGFVAFTEENAPEQLALARDALERASEAESRYEVVWEFESELARLVELYQAVMVMRSVVEALAASDVNLPEEQVAAKVLKASERSLSIAMSFDQADQWTLGIYRAEPDPDEAGRAVLRCVAHKRAIECETSQARVWKEGTGIAGVAYSNGDEIVVPDLQAEGMKAVFGTSANEPRPYDAERYRSMVAVPIKVDGMAKPWGVVSATNDRVQHFSAGDMGGLKPDEGARALASMVALAIAVGRRKKVTRDSA